MARLLLLASLAISALGCGTLANPRDGQDTMRAAEPPEVVVEELKLKDGGPKDLEAPPKRQGDPGDSRLTAESKKAPDRNRADQHVKLHIMVVEVQRSEAWTTGFYNCDTSDADDAKLPWDFPYKIIPHAVVNEILVPLGRARVLAEQTQMCRSGETTTCLSKGMFEMIEYRGIMLTGVNGLPFGLHLTLTPTIMDDARLRLAMQAKISVRDPSMASTLKSRQLGLRFRIGDGQTFAVAGLIENKFGKRSRWQALLADIPILDRLVEAPDPNMIPRELVMFVTPEVVQATKVKE